METLSLKRKTWGKSEDKCNLLPRFQEEYPRCKTATDGRIYDDL
jgi:hypothetical protein